MKVSFALGFHVSFVVTVLKNPRSVAIAGSMPEIALSMWK